MGEVNSTSILANADDVRDLDDNWQTVGVHHDDDSKDAGTATDDGGLISNSAGNFRDKLLPDLDNSTVPVVTTTATAPAKKDSYILLQKKSGVFEKISFYGAVFCS